MLDKILLSRPRFMRFFYTSVHYALLPALLLRLGWRALRYRRDDGARWRERLGDIPAVPAAHVIWVHAVSVGETLAAVPLVKALLAQYPDYRIVMTSTTASGSAQVAQQFGDKVTAFYMPYDLPGSVTRFLNAVHPQLGIILETELWPNVLAECQRRQIPLLLANARLSAHSCRGYNRIKPLTSEMVNSFERVAAQSPQDGERFLSLGLAPQRLQITGNIKFDIQVAPDLLERGQALRRQWGLNRPVWVAASTHEGEETLILQALATVRAEFPDLLLILVPRHPERFSRVQQLCLQNRYCIALRSREEIVTENTAILLGDTMGELMLFYASADIALVGGSFIPIGGHNLIEPAVLGTPVLTGPHLHNFVDVSRLLLEAGGARVVTDAATLAESVIELLKDPEKRKKMGDDARTAVAANTGALTKHLTSINFLLN
jgi:3-deoxy-D-manno-octulosonic-acid transferase